MEITGAKFVSVSLEYKQDNEDIVDHFIISTTAPFEQVWDLHNILGTLSISLIKVPFGGRKRAASFVRKSHRSSSRAMKQQRDSEASPEKPETHDAVSPIPMAPVSAEKKAEESEVKDERSQVHDEVHSKKSDAKLHLPESHAKHDDSSSPVVKTRSPRLIDNDAVSPRDMLHEVTLHKYEYFHWKFLTEPVGHHHLEAVVMVLQNSIATFMSNISYELIGTNANQRAGVHFSRTMMFKLSIE